MFRFVAIGLLLTTSAFAQGTYTVPPLFGQAATGDADLDRAVQICAKHRTLIAYDSNTRNQYYPGYEEPCRVVEQRWNQAMAVIKHQHDVAAANKQESDLAALKALTK